MIREPLMDAVEATIVCDMGVRRQLNNSRIEFMHWYALTADLTPDKTSGGVEFWYADNNTTREFNVGTTMPVRLYWIDTERQTLSRVLIGGVGRSFWTNRSFITDPGRAR